MRRRSERGSMASRPKRRAVGGGTPQAPGAPVPCHEEEENEEMEDQGDDDEDSDEDSDEEEDEDDEAVGEVSSARAPAGLPAGSVLSGRRGRGACEALGAATSLPPRVCPRGPQAVTGSLRFHFGLHSAAAELLSKVTPRPVCPLSPKENPTQHLPSGALF